MFGSVSDRLVAWLLTPRLPKPASYARTTQAASAFSGAMAAWSGLEGRTGHALAWAALAIVAWLVAAALLRYDAAWDRYGTQVEGRLAPLMVRHHSLLQAGHRDIARVEDWLARRESAMRAVNALAWQNALRPPFSPSVPMDVQALPALQGLGTERWRLPSAHAA